MRQELGPPPPVPPTNYPPPPPMAPGDPCISVLNNSLTEVMGTFNQSMNQQCHVLQESLRQSHLASKEHYLSSATPCDGSDPKRFESWIEDVNILTLVADKSPQMVAITTSKGNLHKYIIDLRQVRSNLGPNQEKNYLKDSVSVDHLQWPNTD